MTKETRTENRPSWSFTRLGLLIGVPVAVVVGVNAMAWAAATFKSWNSGDTLTATDLNANFAAVNAAFVDLTSDQTIAGNKTFDGTVAVGFTNTVGVNVSSIPACAGGTCAASGGCTRDLNFVGVFHCMCPSGQSMINGGGLANGGNFLRGAFPSATNAWEFVCSDPSGGGVDCQQLYYTCARLN